MVIGELDLAWQVDLVAGWLLHTGVKLKVMLSPALSLGYWTLLWRVISWGSDDTGLSFWYW